jgi:hypothetical protein
MIVARNLRHPSLVFNAAIEPRERMSALRKDLIQVGKR